MPAVIPKFNTKDYDKIYEDNKYIDKNDLNRQVIKPLEGGGGGGGGRKYG